MCLAYDSTKRPSVENLSLHNGRSTWREFFLQRLPKPGEYESALHEIERLRALLNSSACDTTTTTSNTITIKVLIHPTAHSYRLNILFILNTPLTYAKSKDMHLCRPSPGCRRSLRLRSLGSSPRSVWTIRLSIHHQLHRRLQHPPQAQPFRVNPQPPSVPHNWKYYTQSSDIISFIFIEIL